MAWTNLSSAFGYGTKLTSAQQGQLRDNATYCYDFLASGNLTDHGILLGSGTGPITPIGVMTNGQILVGATGADPVPRTISGHGTLSAAGVLAVTNVNNGIIGQAKLKTSIGSVSVSVPETSSAETGDLPGGEYGFLPQVKADLAAANLNFTGFHRNAVGTAYAPIRAYFYNGYSATHTCYARQRYVTASGEVHWVFILRDKFTKNIISAWQAPDHPCFGNGGKPLLVQHPFGSYDPEKEEILVINPSDKEIFDMQDAAIMDETTPDRDILEVLMDDYEIDEDSTPEWPDEKVTVGLPKDRDWKRDPDGTPVVPIKKKIPKPDYIHCKSLRRKQDDIALKF